jgi:DNA primase
MDVVMSHQGGVTHAVASSGTALTDGHLKIIKRYTDNIDLCFDADSAGEMATTRGVDLALARGFNVGIVTIDEPGIKDPADFVQKKGTAWTEHVQSSRPFLDVFFENAKKNFDISTALGKKLLAQKMLPFIAAIANGVEQAHWLSEISTALRLKEEILRKELLAVKPKNYGSDFEENIPTAAGLEQKVAPQRLNMLEESILSLVIKEPDLAAKLTPENEIFLSEDCRRLIKQAADYFDIHGEGIGQLAVADPALKMSLDIAYLKAQELWNDFEEIQIEREFEILLSQTKKHFVSAQLQKLEYDIKSAEKVQDKILLSKLMIEFSKVSKELGN